MKFSGKDFFSKCDQIRRFHLLKKSLPENFIFCAVLYHNASRGEMDIKSFRVTGQEYKIGVFGASNFYT